MQVTDAEKVFLSLVNKVYAEGVSVDLQRDDKIIARLTPAEKRPTLTVGEFAAFLRSLPSLADDAEQFVEDLQSIRDRS
jgi:antitoxin (DNA-binding transcriptional repressor) of toxin-antitoxin stability system